MNQNMESPIANLQETPEPPVFPQTPHHLRTPPAETTSIPRSPARDNIFSKSRDTREDRGSRQMKTTHNAQTFPHGR